MVLNRCFHIAEIVVKRNHPELLHKMIIMLLPRQGELHQRHSYPLNRILSFFIECGRFAAVKDTLNFMEPIAEKVTASLLDHLLHSRQKIDSSLRSLANTMLKKIESRVIQQTQISKDHGMYPPLEPDLRWINPRHY